MKNAFLCLAMLALAAAAQAQSLADNEHYGQFKSWAMHTQQPNPLRDKAPPIRWTGTVQEYCGDPPASAYR